MAACVLNRESKMLSEWDWIRSMSVDASFTERWCVDSCLRFHKTETLFTERL